MRVSALRIELFIPGARSLKDKRRAVKSLKERIRNRFNVSVAEVDFHDLWQRSCLAVAAVGTDGPRVAGELEKVLAHARGDASVQVTRHEIETLC